MSNHSTFGPAYDENIDSDRIHSQMDTIKQYMLSCGSDDYKTLPEIELATHYPQASISAQLRHLLKPQFGGYVVEKRRRNIASGGGTWEYRVCKPIICDMQYQLFKSPTH